MLGVGGFPPPLAPPLTGGVATRNTVSFAVSLRLDQEAWKTQTSLFSYYQSPSLGRSELCLFALPKHTKSTDTVLEVEDFDEDEDFDYDDDDDDDYDAEEEQEEDEDEDYKDDAFIPFAKMDEWLRNKPRGFGEGNVYDTSTEDKLLEEIAQSRKAQLANLNKLKNPGLEPKPKKVHKNEQKAPEPVPSGIRVHISNLPKKKNIHRDLKSAFQGISAITNMSVAVSGNKKTRDPVCKGFAFLDFNSVEEATQFVQTFSGKTITFGKMEKPIKCELLGSHGDDGAHEPQSRSIPSISKNTMVMDEDHNDGLDLWEGSEETFDEFNECDDEDFTENFESASMSEDDEDEDNDESMVLNTKRGPDFLSNRRGKVGGVKKKSTVNRKTDKVRKLNIPGSARKLKVREKAKLADVFSRYGLASKQD